jgi:5-methylcytosine-specific restriction endonuclease McrA
MTTHGDRTKKWRKRLRRDLVEAQNNLCALCFEPMDPDTSTGPRRATLEHVFPLGRGGQDATSVAAHARCNQRKGHRKPTGCELLALDWVRTKVRASARLTVLVRNALSQLATTRTDYGFANRPIASVAFGQTP